VVPYTITDFTTVAAVCDEATGLLYLLLAAPCLGPQYCSVTPLGAR
jgi:hypothetical protein